MEKGIDDKETNAAGGAEQFIKEWKMAKMANENGKSGKWKVGNGNGRGSALLPASTRFLLALGEIANASAAHVPHSADLCNSSCPIFGLRLEGRMEWDARGGGATKKKTLVGLHGCRGFSRAPCPGPPLMCPVPKHAPPYYRTFPSLSARPPLPRLSYRISRLGLQRSTNAAFPISFPNLLSFLPLPPITLQHLPASIQVEALLVQTLKRLTI